jgi:hypothetical protein
MRFNNTPNVRVRPICSISVSADQKIILWDSADFAPIQSLLDLKESISTKFLWAHCTVKKGSRFSRSPAGMSLTKLSLAGNNLIIPAQGEFGN